MGLASRVAALEKKLSERGGKHMVIIQVPADEELTPARREAAARENGMTVEEMESRCLVLITTYGTTAKDSQEAGKSASKDQRGIRV